MFKLFVVYPFVVLVAIWVASDVEVGASLYAFGDNHFSIEFPKVAYRSEENPEPWYSYYWNAESTREGLQKINDAVSQ